MPDGRTSFWKIILGVGCGLSLVALLMVGTCTACVGKVALDTARDYERQKNALAALELGCKNGDGRRCVELGDHNARYLPEQQQTILAYERACELKEIKGCYKAGLFWKKNHYRIDSDPSKAAQYLKKACDGAVREACTELASLYRNGQGSVSRNVQSARSLYQQGCDAGSATACQSLAFMYKNGEGTASDPRKSSALFGRACEEGLPSSCVSLAEHYFVGFGVPTDVDRGRNLLDVACRKREVVACQALEGSRPELKGNKLATKRAWNQMLEGPSALAIFENVQTNKEVLARLSRFRDAYARIDATEAHPELVQHLSESRAWADDAIRYFEDAERRRRMAADLEYITVIARVATEKNEQGERDITTFLRAEEKGKQDSEDFTANPDAPEDLRSLGERMQRLAAHHYPLALRLEMAHGVLLSPLKERHEGKSGG
jgi:TPR repeat protein